MGVQKRSELMYKPSKLGKKSQMFQKSKYFIVYSGTSIKIVLTNHARVLCLKFCDIVFVMGTLQHKMNWLQCPSGDRQMFCRAENTLAWLQCALSGPDDKNVVK